MGLAGGEIVPGSLKYPPPVAPTKCVSDVHEILGHAFNSGLISWN